MLERSCGGSRVVRDKRQDAPISSSAIPVQGATELAPTSRMAHSEVMPASHSDDSRTRWELLALLGLALVAGIYFVLRYGGRWSEADSGAITQAIRVVVDSAQLIPDSSAKYQNGYGYQAVSVAIMAFTGLSVETLQQMVYPLVSAVLVLPAWTLYRELTGSSRVASLATLLLLLVPEYLFAVLRASHERLDRAFLFTALWLLARSVRFRGDPTRFTVHLGVALLASYGLIATNGLFGMSFVLAIVTALAISWLARRGPDGVRDHAIVTTRLLRWVSGAMITLVAIFILFVYPPFGVLLRILSAIPGTLLRLIVNGGAIDPYAGVLTAWVSPVVYLLLSMVNILMLAGSALVWLWLGWSWFRRHRRSSVGMWMLWVLYAAFAVQGAVSLLSDRTGSLSGNVLYRVFAVFALFAAPLVAVGLSRWHPRPWLRSVAVAAIAGAAACAFLKSTLEPELSNKWLFYTSAEVQGLRWADDHQRNTQTWVGPDDRLVAAYQMEVGDPTGANHWEAYDPKPGIQSFIVSDPIRLQSDRLGKEMPPLGTANVVYDNGQVQLYRLPSPIASGSP